LTEEAEVAEEWEELPRAEGLTARGDKPRDEIERPMGVDVDTPLPSG
jgi:hypothetical protein